MTFFAYRQYYPPLTSEVSHRPYSPRIKDDPEDNDSPILPTTYAQGQSSGYSPASYNGGGGYGSSRYNQTPSPPLNPFEPDGRNPGDHLKLGIDGTVQRPGHPQHLEEMWKEGGDGYDGTVSRPRSREGSNSENAHSRGVSGGGGGPQQIMTRELPNQQQQQQSQKGAVMTPGSPPVTPFVNAQENSFSIPLRATAAIGSSGEAQTKTGDQYQSAYDGIR